MTGDSHPTEQGSGKPLEAPQSREAPFVGTERRPGGEFGPQAATDGFDGPEIHRWDAAKTAEVARLLAEHPPRSAQWITSNADQPEAPMPEPTPAEPDNPAAWALARHIADHPVSTIQAAFRYLDTPIAIELHDPAVSSATAPAELREQVAEALMAWAESNNAPQYASMRRPDTVRRNAYSRADAVLRVPAIRDLLERIADYENRITWETSCGSCARILDASILEHERADRAESAVRSWLPVLRRAVDCLDTTCRYHGDRLDPDRFGRMTRSEACCDTGIEPRRALEARAALEALAALDQQEQQ